MCIMFKAGIKIIKKTFNFSTTQTPMFVNHI